MQWIRKEKYVLKIESYLRQVREGDREREKTVIIRNQKRLLQLATQANKYISNVATKSKKNMESKIVFCVWQVDLMHLKSIFSASMAHSNSRLSVLLTEIVEWMFSKNLCQVYFMLMKLHLYDICVCVSARESHQMCTTIPFCVFFFFLFIRKSLTASKETTEESLDIGTCMANTWTFRFNLQPSDLFACFILIWSTFNCSLSYYDCFPFIEIFDFIK